ncbi:MAG: YraN family protein [Janthinobacterium lividum]
MGTERQAVGRRGEDLAVAELQRQGMEVLARNWRCGRLGEVDVVALDRTTGVPTVVVCEVKCRSGLGFGHPLEAITWAKLRTLRQLAAEWVRDHPTGPVRIRIDAIGVVLLRGQDPQLTHARGVG